jgi:vibriolysin
VRTICAAWLAAWLGASVAACGVVEEGGGGPEETRKDADVQAMLARLDGVEVLGLEDGAPTFIRGSLGKVSSTVSAQMMARDGEVSAQVRGTLDRVAPMFRLSSEELVFKRTSTDERGHQFLRFQQVRNGLVVVGGEMLLHVDTEGNVYAANGSLRHGASSAAQARVVAEAAMWAALHDSRALNPVAEGAARQVYFKAEGSLRLAYEVRVTGEQADGLPMDNTVYVDAENGRTLATHSHIHTAQNRAVYSANNTTTLPGTLKRDESGAVTGDTHVDKNHDHLGTTYQCYRQNFARDSFDNAGALIKSSVHYGTALNDRNNARWNGSQMMYGDGDGVQYGPMGESLDITVHEFTHAVTDHTSKLVYANESGALNEGMSDIFSAYCEAWQKGWITNSAVYMIGDDVQTPGTPGDAMRYMANPTQDGMSRDYYPERYTDTDDNGGVHRNSGIANLAFYLLSEGGKHPREKSTVQVPAIGIQKAGKIFYEANAHCMTSSSTFDNAKTCTVQKANELFDSTVADAVTKAWAAVGVPPTTVLTNGSSVSGLSDSSRGKMHFLLEVPSGQTSLTFTTSGGAGDVDLYVKFGSAPDSSTSTCRSTSGRSEEECYFSSPTGGTWYVILSAYSSYSGVTLTGMYGTSSGSTLSNSVESAVYSGSKDTWRCFTLSVPPGKASLKFDQFAKSGSSGDADMYVRFGSAPDSRTYDCRPYSGGNAERCSFTNPAGGTWYACSHGYSEYTNVAIRGFYQSFGMAPSGSGQPLLEAAGIDPAARGSW